MHQSINFKRKKQQNSNITAFIVLNTTNVNQKPLTYSLRSKHFRSVIIQRQKEQQENAFLVFYKDSSNTHQVNNIT